MKVRCDINGLDCPHCALELSKLLAKEDAISSADINFPMKSLVMEVADDADEEQILELAQKVADNFEDGIEIDLRD
ncbi:MULTISPECIES: heavy-metal-associated domain-containing protein [unclassified Anaerobiospirillum]|uniref:heavy-metal-associated domain-containing protein n=1 Tax=unclassified Anaerobiospirillum TaxID=2647410 RepID=UPI001FF3D268|nr:MULTISPECIES: heavy-metal-associated domain-containing protein [unclassified Anaerobiospirillum]MCK0526044.1 heavy-metal-associated domain-containing protein [Anaerobiospirillum sp. NML120449]MCK0535598.1 heavy-metal-associated domain-containing protein [Anaerobiospirillum sp. NML120511]MCK0540735.1 heavy-metal-associated domain-containing protein [Anaerobiospirillum sp. NML02-A-032]